MTRDFEISFFVPMHVQPVYINQFREQSFPVAESLCRSGLYLPTSEVLTEKDIEWIFHQINDTSVHGDAPKNAVT